MNSLKFIGKIIFLLFTIIYMIIPLCIVIYMKINNPSFKNLNTTETIIYIVFTILFIILNFVFFKSYFIKKDKI